MLIHRDIDNKSGRPLVPDSQACAVVAPLPMTERCDEVEPLHEAARRLAHDDVDFAAGAGYLRRAAAAGGPGLRLLVRAPHSRIEIGETIDLGAAEKPDGEPFPLQPVAEHCG